MQLRTPSLLLLCAISASLAQDAAESPSFEVAAIKPADSSGRPRFAGGPGTDSPGQLVVSNYPLQGIVQRAFGKSHPWEIANLDSAVPNDRYDVAAKSPPGVTREQFYLMIQKLLAERFGLLYHNETREMPGYELVAAKDGPRLTAVEKRPDAAQAAQSPRLATGALPKDEAGWPILPPDAVGTFAALNPPYMRRMFRAQTIAPLLEYLRLSLDRPLVDKTGLDGIYNYDLTIMREQPGSDASAEARRDVIDQEIPNLLAGVERLGLKVVSAKGPVEIMVIDKMNKKPAQN